jgi:hypothetical protein
VLGERSSGTNLAKRLLTRNSSLKPSEDLGWKHGFPHATAIPADLLVLGLVRNAMSWALSMHAKPWHTSPRMQALPFSDFIRAPWDTRVDRARYFPDSDRLGQVGQPLQHDRHPLTGEMFPNLFAMRTAKLQALLSYSNRDCHFALMQAERLQSDPETTLRNLRSALRLPDPEGAFRPVHKRLGSKFKAAVDSRPESPRTISPEDRDFILSQLDLSLERHLGYTY